MDVRHVKQIARDWISANEQQWPGFRAAHFVGGITSLPDDAPFPVTRDVDLHLIFDESTGPPQVGSAFANIVEVHHDGVMIEAGVKSVVDYASPDVVLANPEIAHHLLVNSIAFDPSELLSRLRHHVARDYAKRTWVQTRVEFERAGHQGALAMFPMVMDAYGPSGVLNMTGHASTYLVAAIAFARLQPPRLGGKMGVRLHEHLTELGRLDLHERFLALFGLRDVTREQVGRYLIESGEAFGRAMAVEQTPHFFEHKLHPHLRPYFVDSGREMIEAGFHREERLWLMACLCASTDVILTDGTAEDRAPFSARREQLFQVVSFDTEPARTEKRHQLDRFAEDIFVLVENIMWDHPHITD